MARRKEQAEAKPVEKKKQQRRPASKKQQDRKGTKSNNKVIRYFQETSLELKKVAWPSRDETIRLSTIVLVATIVTSVFLGLLYHYGCSEP